jgi:hypothetical protein
MNRKVKKQSNSRKEAQKAQKGMLLFLRFLSLFAAN